MTALNSWKQIDRARLDQNLAALTDELLQKQVAPDHMQST
jgi:hypothetical protein